MMLRDLSLKCWAGESLRAGEFEVFGIRFGRVWEGSGSFGSDASGDLEVSDPCWFSGSSPVSGPPGTRAITHMVEAFSECCARMMRNG